MNRESLIALRDAVVAGEWDHSQNGVARKVFPYKSASIDDLGLTAAEAFKGSVDAAIALLETMLPGWRISLKQAEIIGSDDTFLAAIWPMDATKKAHVFHPAGRHKNPARALLIATLNAMIERIDT